MTPREFDFEGTTAIEPLQLSRQQGLILERLKQGPATNADLAEIALKYTGRISELREKLKARGQDIKVTKIQAHGIRVYELVNRCPR